MWYGTVFREVYQLNLWICFPSCDILNCSILKKYLQLVLDWKRLKKLSEIAKGCPRYISLVVKVSSCSYHMSHFKSLNNVLIWVQHSNFFELLSVVVIWTFAFSYNFIFLICHKKCYFVSQFDLLMSQFVFLSFVII